MSNPRTCRDSRVLAVRSALWLCLAMPLCAQQPAPQAATFTSSAQLVIETVTVRDKAGKTIEGLTPQDFVVTEDGKPQVIKFLEFQKLDNTPAPPSPPEEIARVTQHEILPESPGNLRYRDRRLLALYFDMSAMRVPEQFRALAAARKFVKTQMTPADMIAVLQFAGRGVQVMQDFTSDRALLDAALQKLVAGDGADDDSNNNDDSDADKGTAFGQDDSEFNVFTTDRQLAALQTAVKMLGQLNERKSLIYFASGLRLSGTNNQAQLRSTTNSAVRANVAIFTVDARGLVAQAPLGDATQGSPGGIAMYSGSSALAVQTNFQHSQDTLYALAGDTGGKALLDNNDLTAGIVQAQQANSSYYVIGYYSTNTALDGKYRRVRIALREITAKLDFRTGYYAGKTFNKFTTADKERQLEDALLLEDPITELTIAMELNYFQLNRAEYYVPLAVKIPGSELALARRRGADHTLIDFIGEIKDEFGVTVQNVRDKVDIKLSDEIAGHLAEHPIQYDTGFTLLPGTYRIKFLARDDETGRIGTYLNKFVVPNLNKEEKRIPISSVVLGSQRVDLSAAIYNAAGKRSALDANPLVQEGRKLIPSVTRVFSKARDLYVYLQAYEPSTPALEPLIAYVTFYRGPMKAFETPLMPVTEGLSTRLKTMPMRFSLALDKLPAGRYICQVTVVDPTSSKAAFWQAPVMLVP